MSQRGAVLARTTDLLFATRIGDAASAARRAYRTAPDDVAMDAALRETSPSLVLIDLSCGPVPPVAQAYKHAHPDARIVAFGSHVDRDALAAALHAGVDDAWPRSVFVQRLRELLA